MRSAPNALSLLRTCKQVYDETKDLWIGRTLFSFEEPEALLRKLSALLADIVSSIRHVRSSGYPIKVFPPGDEDGVYYRTGSGRLEVGILATAFTYLN